MRTSPRPLIAAGYVDDKIVAARRMLKANFTLSEMAPALGYRNKSSVAYYLRMAGLPLPSVKGRNART
jgi:hypothetical protein